MSDMKRVFTPTAGPECWRAFLAEPGKQWRTGYSAKTLAYCWEDAWAKGDGFPPEVRQVFAAYGRPFSDGFELLLAIPEYQVKLPPEDRMPSCNDLFVLARAADGLVAIMVEGKVGEPFGKQLKDWLADAPAESGKPLRLNHLKNELGVTGDIPPSIHYQLVHRTASAVIEAKRLFARYAVMLVHSFSATNARFPDYQAFIRLFGVEGRVNGLTSVADYGKVRLFCGWVHGDEAFTKV